MLKNLSPFAENRERKLEDECEEVSASGGFCFRYSRTWLGRLTSRRSRWEKMPRSSYRGASLLFAFIVISTLLVVAVVYYRLINSNNKASPDRYEIISAINFSEFLVQKRDILTTDGGDELSLIAVGDISYSRGVGRTIKKQGDINYPFLKVADLLQGADLTFGNLETPITPGREIADLEMTFRSDPGMQEAIKDAGFNILSLANNHTPNFGERGLTDTFSYLESVGIKYVGAGKDDTEAGSPVIIDIKGVSIAFLAYNDEDVVPPDYEAGNHPGTALMRFEKMFSAVMDAKKMADVVVVSMHSGTEYIQKPNDSQVEFAHGAIDAGADLVVGHHPHVVQTMEKYKGKYIFYSLGNFVFDQMWSRETREGLMIKVYLNTSGVDRIYLLPIVIENYSQPRLASVEEAEKIVKRLTTPVEGASVFTWNKVKQDFDKGNRAVIYNNDRANRVINIKTKVADLDNDGNLENYSLDEGRLSISESSKVVWASPGEWWIYKFEISDVYKNGIAEISLSLWKEGSFGSSKPFWVRENDTSVKNHFFVYRFEDNYMKPVWHSSNLSEPNCGFKIDDVDDDGKNDLVVIEGDYMDFPECKGKYVAVWGWNGWGFTNKWRSGEGNFSKLEIEKMGGENSINADLF